MRLLWIFLSGSEQHDLLGKEKISGKGHIAFHVAFEYGQPVENAREATQHVVEQNREIWTDNPFDRRMADVALVPQRHVLHRRKGIAPKQAGQAGEVLEKSGRLWGIAEEPFCPCEKYSSTSRISVCWSRRISVAIFSIEQPIMANVEKNCA